MLKNKIGLGLRTPYVDYVVKNAKSLKEKIGFFEVHSENYYGDGGASIDSLVEIAKDFSISFHSVGNSLGSASGIDLYHLDQLKKLIKTIDPFLISDHISWGKIKNAHLNDLLPLPLNKESLQILCDNISKVQDVLKKPILVENPSTYLAFKNDEILEYDFINEIAKKTGCGLLLDVNNVFVTAKNNQVFDPETYLNKINKKIVKEIHLAGHLATKILGGKEILIDTHNDKVRKEVWNLYKVACKKFGEIPTLIEWDQDYPEFKILLSEVQKAKNIMDKNA